MKNFMAVLIPASIALVYSVFILIKELKIYLRKSNEFENNVNVKEGIIKRIEKTKKKFTLGVYKYTVYVELPDNKIIKTIIKPKKASFGRGANRYINRKKT